VLTGDLDRERRLEGLVSWSSSGTGIWASETRAGSGWKRTVVPVVPSPGIGMRPVTRFLEFCRYLRSFYPPTVRIAIVCDNYSPHLSIAKASRVGDWIEPNNVEIAYPPASSLG
jgi:hypothetical protein